eukprot:1161469-Pelagomonas_calceolata.AAC.29
MHHQVGNGSLEIECALPSGVAYILLWKAPWVQQKRKQRELSIKVGFTRKGPAPLKKAKGDRSILKGTWNTSVVFTMQEQSKCKEA